MNQSSESLRNKKQLRNEKKSLLILKANALQAFIRLQIHQKNRPVNKVKAITELFSENANVLKWQSFIHLLTDKIADRYQKKHWLQIGRFLFSLFNR